MTIEQRKEQLSNRFIGILATNKGYVIDKPEVDLGIDYQVKKTKSYTMANGNTRYTTDSRYIDIQLKSTTEVSIIDEPDLIKYDLEAKSYNDMIDRQNSGFVPLILILFVLPHDVNTWVDIDINEIKLRKHAYWYMPAPGELQTTNTTSKRIEIPKTNILGIDCFDILHNQLYPVV